MSKIWLPGGGGGADLDVITAEADDVLAGKVIVDKEGEPLTGSLALTGTAADSQVLSGQTYYNTDAKTKRTGGMTNRGAWTGTAARNGSVTIPAGYHNGSGKVNGPSIADMAGGTKTPTTSQQTIACSGKYMTSNIIIPAFSLPSASQLIAGTSYTIYGRTVNGTAAQFVNSPATIYNSGTWGSGYGYSFSSTNGDIEVNYANRSFSIGSAHYANLYLRYDTAVNLSAYKYLKVDTYVHDCEMNICVSSNANFSGYTAASTRIGGRNSSILISDVTSLNGMYYIYFSIKTGDSMTSYISISSISLANS